MSEENVTTKAELVVNNQKKPEATSDERKQSISFLTMRMKPDTNPPKLQQGALTDGAKHFDQTINIIGAACWVAKTNNKNRSD